MNRIINILIKFFDKRLVLFICIGFLVTIVHYTIYFLLLIYFPAELSYTIGFLISFILNYLLNSKITFSVNRTLRNVIGFIFCHVINYIIQFVVFNVLLYLSLDELIAPFFVYMVSVPVNYVLVRLMFYKFR